MITHVWIEEGCIGCGACPLTAPAVFAIDEETSDALIRGEVRMDGLPGDNRIERSPLWPVAAFAETLAIQEAAEGCPVEVIRYREAG